MIISTQVFHLSKSTKALATKYTSRTKHTRYAERTISESYCILLDHNY